MKNIGIIGCGKIAQTRHIPEYMDNQDSRLAAFYDVNAERARFLAKKYGGRAYGTYRELLQDKEIDAVSVCVPNELHAQISIEALKAGKDVLCEKPPPIITILPFALLEKAFAFPVLTPAISPVAANNLKKCRLSTPFFSSASNCFSSSCFIMSKEFKILFAGKGNIINYGSHENDYYTTCANDFFIG